MTVCNMAIEMGARAGMIASDDTTFAYLKGRPFAPKARIGKHAVNYWRSLTTDPGATYDKVEVVHTADMLPQVTWGTTPAMVAPVTATCQIRPAFSDPTQHSRCYVAPLTLYGSATLRHSVSGYCSEFACHRTGSCSTNSRASKTCACARPPIS